MSVLIIDIFRICILDYFSIFFNPASDSLNERPNYLLTASRLFSLLLEQSRLRTRVDISEAKYVYSRRPHVIAECLLARPRFTRVKWNNNSHSPAVLPQSQPVAAAVSCSNCRHQPITQATAWWASIGVVTMYVRSASPCYSISLWCSWYTVAASCHGDQAPPSVLSRHALGEFAPPPNNYLTLFSNNGTRVGVCRSY